MKQRHEIVAVGIRRGGSDRMLRKIIFKFFLPVAMCLSGFIA